MNLLREKRNELKLSQKELACARTSSADCGK